MNGGIVINNAVKIKGNFTAQSGLADKIGLAGMNGFENIGGLSDKEVKLSREKYGENVFSVRKKKSFIRSFLSNLGDPIIKILIIALFVNVLFMLREADWFETAGIAVSIFLATLISTLSEYGSEAAFERLSEECNKTKCRVVRKAEIILLDIGEIVVGDCVLIGAGEQIPADGELISGEITTDQSSMTGESIEVLKRVRRGIDEDNFTPSSPYYCLRGCVVLSGEGCMKVKNVGDKTFLGGISREIQTETRESPLKLRLRKLAGQISKIGYVAAVLVALVYLFNVLVLDSAFDTAIIKYKLMSFPYLFSQLFHALTLGLTVVVMAVPEGLPMMIAVVLSSNIKRMVKNNVLVRKPAGIEAAGSMNILFTDKTGTLTEGKLSVGKIFCGSGECFENVGQLKKSGGKIYVEFLNQSFINSSSSVGKNEFGKKCALGGNSTDRAMLEAVVRNAEKTDGRAIEKIPFDSEKKYSACCVSDKGRRVLYIKGAPDKLIAHLTSYIGPDGQKHTVSTEKISKLCSGVTSGGGRMILLARSEEQNAFEKVKRGQIGNLDLIALVVLEDKIRETARSSVLRLRRAGIDVVMITGDSKDTARSIAESCGIIDAEHSVILTSTELSHMSDTALKEALPSLAVVARALPGDKSRLIRISQELELVVGMTGDGINDAPALKRADVGFSMGNGTQVAKDAGDIIILDNDLYSITNAVLYGRNIFKSIRKFITLQLMMNFCAVGVSMICPFLGIDAPVTVVQMLWINIIMDTLGGMAFAGEAALSSCMDEKPKRRDEPILNGYMVHQIVFQGGFTVALCIMFLKLPGITSLFRWSNDNIYLLTAFFALFIFSSVFNCFNARTDRLKLFAGIGQNPTFVVIMFAVLLVQILFVYLGGPVLRTAPLTLKELGVTSLIALSVIPAEFLRKLSWRLLAGKKGY